MSFWYKSQDFPNQEFWSLGCIRRWQVPSPVMNWTLGHLNIWTKCYNNDALTKVCLSSAHYLGVQTIFLNKICGCWIYFFQIDIFLEKKHQIFTLVVSSWNINECFIYCIRKYLGQTQQWVFRATFQSLCHVWRGPDSSLYNWS